MPEHYSNSWESAAWGNISEHEKWREFYLIMHLTRWDSTPPTACVLKIRLSYMCSHRSQVLFNMTRGHVCSACTDTLYSGSFSWNGVYFQHNSEIGICYISILYIINLLKILLWEFYCIHFIMNKLNCWAELYIVDKSCEFEFK